MSDTTKKAAPSTSACSVSVPANVPRRPKVLSVRSVASNLHKRILKKNVKSSASDVLPPTQHREEYPDVPVAAPEVETRCARSVERVPSPPCSRTVSETSVPVTSVPESSPEHLAAIDRVENWKQCGISPPKELTMDDETDNVSESSLPTSARCKRTSMLIAHCSKRTGVEMDSATKVANDALLRGKDALEQSTNQRRDLKQTAIESLQTLFEIVLSLAESRHRHISSLEQERTRHAMELLSVERAHTKSTQKIYNDLTKEVALARETLSELQKEIKAVRDWQSFESREPHQHIKATAEAVRDISGFLKSPAPSRNASVDLTPLQNNYLGLKTGIEILRRQVDELHRDSNAERAEAIEVLHQNAKILKELASTPPPPTPPNYSDRLSTIEKILTKQTPPPSSAPIRINIDEHVLPITERLEAVSSELRTMRQEKLILPPPALSIEAEICQAETGKPSKPNYAKIAAKPIVPKPNHTLIVTTANPTSPTTAEKLIDRIAVALDTKTTGARVDRVRKGRNRKVILSCSTEEDLGLVRNRVQQDKTLKVETAKAGNPLIIIRDVLSYHKDNEIVENLLAQNKHLLQGVNLQESAIRVRYRKKARNQHECHPVIEVSPRIHRAFLDAEKVYIGLQRRPVADHSPLVQCTKCLGFGHTKAICRERDESCSHCGKAHTWTQCKARKEDLPPRCKNCAVAHPNSPNRELAHNAFSSECPERVKWDGIARSRITYC